MPCDPVCVGIDTASFFISGKQADNAPGGSGFGTIVDHLAAAALLDNFCKFRFKFKTLKNLGHFPRTGKKQTFDLVKLHVWDKAIPVKTRPHISG